MNKPDDTKHQTLEGKRVVSAISTGGGGAAFQVRVASLYLANMLTGTPTVFGLHGARVETLRLEARYVGAHTDDIYCAIRDQDRLRLLLIQCKRGLDAVPSNAEFVDALNGAWRDFLGLEGSPFDQGCDVLALATVAPGSPATRAAKRLCELARASVDLPDFQQKLNSGLFDAQHKRTWGAFSEVSKTTLQERYSDEMVFALLQRLRVDIHDLGVDASQELSLVQALLDSNCPGDSGEQVWSGLFTYVFEQGVSAGTITRETWKATAPASLQEAISRVTGLRGLGGSAERLSERSVLQLSLIATSLPNGAHIPRGQCAAQVLAAFDRHQAVIVTGGAGVGKSAVIAELVPLLRESGPVFFFRTDELDTPSLSAVQSLSGMSDPLISLDKLLGHGTPTIVIDSLEKALEARSPGALEELLTLMRRHRTARLCVTTRSYAVNALFANFLADFTSEFVEIPLLTDAELSVAVAGTPLEPLVLTDSSVREVLRAPFYIRLALNHTAAGAAIPQATATDLRLALWTEKVAPSKGCALGFAARRRAAFDQICYARTERSAQFVDPPTDAEAVSSLLRDDVLVEDATGRVAPAHDVLEDWSLFFRIQREVRGCERDWELLFGKLQSHPGMRRALRAWTALRSAEGDEDAYALLKAALARDATVPQLWRDEICIGFLRSDAVDELVAKVGRNVSFADVDLMQRLGHLLRVACKGPTAIDHSGMTDDPSFAEMRLRFGMAAPVGKAWDVVMGLVAKYFPLMPADSHSWVVQLAEDATSHDANWHKPSGRVQDAFSIAEHFCRNDSDDWLEERGIAKRFFALLCRCAGAAPSRFEAIIEALLHRISADSEGREFRAEERLQFLVDVKNCREACLFVPDLVWRVFNALYIDDGRKAAGRYGMNGQEAKLGLSERAARGFFPPSALQGPFRSLLLYAWPKSVLSIVELCNRAAQSLADMAESEVVIIPSEQSPNTRPHIHSFQLWSSYRGLGITSYLLNSALMALEERLLIEAKPQPETVSLLLEVILERGNSSLTTGLVASVLSAHPELITENLLSIFKCPQFFFSDIARSVQEAGALAIYGGHDGLDSVRQQERVASNGLAHRRQHLEGLLLGLQLQRPELRNAAHSILDTHIAAMDGTPSVSDGWRMALKRMDVRGLRLGEAAGDRSWVPLEIATLEPELKQVSDLAEARMTRMNRISGLRTWAGAIVGRFSGADLATRERFLSASEAQEEFVRLAEEVENDEQTIFAGLEDELAYALCTKWPSENSAALLWARSFVLEQGALREHEDAWLGRDRFLGEVRARTIIRLAAVDPSQAGMVEVLINLVTEPVWDLRLTVASEIAEHLAPRQPVLAEALVTSLAHYADAIAKGLTKPNWHNGSLLTQARETVANRLNEALKQATPDARPSPSGLVGIREWLIAITAARGDTRDTWRIDALTTLADLAAKQENQSRRSYHDPEHVNFESRRELAELLAAELLSQPDDTSGLFAELDHWIEKSPDLTVQLLDSVLVQSDKQGYTDATAFWRIWDRATAKVFPQTSLRTKSRRHLSKYDEVLRSLLLCSVPWHKGFYDLTLLRSRPCFIADGCLAVGDSRAGLRYLMQLAAGVGRASAVPSALPQFRDALEKVPADIFEDSNCLWDAETISRVAVHEHREDLIRNARLRKATLDILDRLVDAGSSLGFQLRDYLAATPTKPET